MQQSQNYFLEKSTRKIVTELVGWNSLADWKLALDRTGTLSERQEYLDGLSDAELEIVTPEQAQKIASVPEQISSAQVRLVLNRHGLRQAVETAIDQSGDQDLKDEWAHRTEFRRDWSSLNFVAKTILGWTDNQLDDLFIEGQDL